MSKSPKWVKGLVPEGTRENVQPLVLRKQIRYRLFRLRSEAVDEIEFDDTPKGFKKFYADQKWFDGWENFAVTWDVGDPENPEPRGSGDPLEVVPRYMSIEEEWEETLADHIRSDTIGTRMRKRAKQVEARSAELGEDTEEVEASEGE